MSDFYEEYDYEQEFEEGWHEDQSPFYNPGGDSALRAGVREHPCPTCGRPDALTAEDVKRGYQCDRCARALEGGMEY